MSFIDFNTISVIILILIIVGILYYVYKYINKEDDEY